MIPFPYQAAGAGMVQQAESSGGSPFWGITTTTTGTSVSASARLGWVFTVTGGNLLCNSLRVRVRTSTSGNELVIVHRNSDDAVMASATINTNASDTWFAATVADFTLVDGETYTVSSRRGGTSRATGQNPTVTYNSALTGLSTGTVTSSDDNRPTGASGATWRICDFGYV